jgi:hypothetical protein
MSVMIFPAASDMGRNPFNLGYQLGDQDAAHESSDKDDYDPHDYLSLLIRSAHALSLTAGSIGPRAGMTADIMCVA